jgi:hypothetical protein
MGRFFLILVTLFLQSFPLSVAGAQNYVEKRKGTRVITNRDLEPHRLVRERAEKEYESRFGKRVESTPKEIELKRPFEETESYWRNRAMQLKGEMQELEAEIDFYRSRIDADSSVSLSSTIHLFPSVIWHPFNFPSFHRPYSVNYPPIISSDYQRSYTRAIMLEKLRALEAGFARLEVRWNLLEEEARRAGALPGWLRP